MQAHVRRTIGASYARLNSRSGRLNTIPDCPLLEPSRAGRPPAETDESRYRHARSRGDCRATRPSSTPLGPTPDPGRVDRYRAVRYSPCWRRRRLRGGPGPPHPRDEAKIAAAREQVGGSDADLAAAEFWCMWAIGVAEEIDHGEQDLRGRAPAPPAGRRPLTPVTQEPTPKRGAFCARSVKVRPGGVGMRRLAVVAVVVCLAVGVWWMTTPRTARQAVG